ncbi:hypothetical protein [Streptosporangium sp. KLBMP 9127]|nr:hypothetical protein [Streptosporangium sp. KLBMP 9127]
MKRFAIAVAALGLTVAALGLTASCAAGTADTVATAGITAAPIRVWNLYGAEQGRADERPADLVLSEFTTANRITWRSWGPKTAVGTGAISGTWCLPGCLDKPYPATITLSDTRSGYFTKFQVEGDFPRPNDSADTLTGTLATP